MSEFRRGNNETFRFIQHSEKHHTGRTTQIVFGERQHLLRVLDSIENTNVSRPKFEQERRTLEQLIHGRTQELNSVNDDWDLKVGMLLSADAKPELLEKLFARSSRARLLFAAANQRTSAGNCEDSEPFAKHPYAAIRENVARHPNADSATLTALSKDRSQPLWYLVAFNPNTPAALRAKLQERLRKLGQTNSSSK